LSSGGKIKYIHRPCINYRVHDSQQSSSLSKSFKKYDEIHWILSKIRFHVKLNCINRKCINNLYVYYVVMFGDMMRDLFRLRLIDFSNKIFFLFFKRRGVRNK